MDRNPYGEFYRPNANKTQIFGSGKFRRNWAVAPYNAKVKLTLYQTMKAKRGNRGAILFL